MADQEGVQEFAMVTRAETHSNGKTSVSLFPSQNSVLDTSSEMNFRKLIRWILLNADSARDGS